MVPTDSSSVFQRLISQTASSPTFAPPPLDGSLTIPEIYEYHLEYNGDHPLFLYDFNDEAVTVQWKQAVHAIRRAARIIHREVQPPPCMPNKTDKAPVIAILAVIGRRFQVLSVFTSGIIRAGFTAFPISPRNSDVGINNLLQKTGAKYMFISRDSAMQGMAAAALEIPGVDGVQLLEIPTFDALYGVKVLEEPVFLPPVVKQNIDSTVMILHSSAQQSSSLCSDKLFGGAPIQKIVGDDLVAKGVKLYPFYGACVNTVPLTLTA
ncbi:hypothetical protein C0989_010220 [Termitomyces sp. Mn162]|nr:hypothetical protein C0989_010220 [Termitomyces sp. Mn162]